MPSKTMPDTFYAEVDCCCMTVGLLRIVRSAISDTPAAWWLPAAAVLAVLTGLMLSHCPTPGRLVFCSIVFAVGFIPENAEAPKAVSLPCTWQLMLDTVMMVAPRHPNKQPPQHEQRPASLRDLGDRTSGQLGPV